MPGPSENPTLESIVPVISACADREKVDFAVCVDCLFSAIANLLEISVHYVLHKQSYTHALVSSIPKFTYHRSI
jgi:hypothetical protein